MSIALATKGVLPGARGHSLATRGMLSFIFSIFVARNRIAELRRILDGGRKRLCMMGLADFQVDLAMQAYQHFQTELDTLLIRVETFELAQPRLIC